MYLDRYNRWLAQPLEDADLTRELQSIKGDDEAIRDRFAIDLSFGTAGMRGVIGAGTNRMNIYTVRRATQGMANTLLNRHDGVPSVAIAYDSRIKSGLFAREAAAVLAANGIRVHLYPALEPVPVLSFAVRYLETAAGVMITASHNPAKYNGYKVYGPDGCQMNTASAGAVLAEIEQLDIFDGIATMSFDDAVEQELVQFIDNEVLQAYYEAVEAQAIRPGLLAKSPLKVVYSPLNGAGNVPVRRVLRDCGLADITVVPEQEKPDGNFPTAPYPNPEIREALTLGIALAEETRADLMLATDPDADRVGTAVRDKTGAYRLLSGNEMGVLLLDYICKGRKEAGTLPENPITIKSFVSTPMADAVAKKQGVQVINVPTGFKFIGEQILGLENRHQAGRFIFGFEESYGYLAGTHVRDKDAVVASMLICEMAAWYHGQGLSLYEAMEALYAEYGRYLNEVESFEFDGLAGMEKMEALMAGLRKTPPAALGSLAVEAVADYQAGTRTTTATGAAEKLDMPATNVLEYTLAGGSTVIVRPSGTEPKIKVYYAVRAATLPQAQETRTMLGEAIKP